MSTLPDLLGHCTSRHLGASTHWYLDEEVGFRAALHGAAGGRGPRDHGVDGEVGHVHALGRGSGGLWIQGSGLRAFRDFLVRS